MHSTRKEPFHASVWTKNSVYFDDRIILSPASFPTPPPRTVLGWLYRINLILVGRL